MMMMMMMMRMIAGVNDDVNSWAGLDWDVLRILLGFLIMQAKIHCLTSS